MNDEHGDLVPSDQVREAAGKESWKAGWEPITDTAICIHGSPEWKAKEYVLLLQDGHYVVMSIHGVAEGPDSDYPELYDLQKLVQADELSIEAYQKKAAAVIKAASAPVFERHTAPPKHVDAGDVTDDMLTDDMVTDDMVTDDMVTDDMVTDTDADAKTEL
jgi:hypothetical protein